MSTKVILGDTPFMAGTVEVPTAGRMLMTHGEGYSVYTEAIGSTTVTFDGVPAGSEIRVYDPDKNELAGIESCAADQVLTWSVYASGSPNNTVRIVIINMAHRIKEFTYTSKLGAQSIPVQPEVDKWWNNPA